MQRDLAVSHALDATGNGVFKNLNQASLGSVVPTSSLYHRSYGRPTRSEAHSSQQRLHDDQEKELESWVQHLARCRRPATLHQLRNWGTYILQRSDPGATRLGYRWSVKFRQRHPHLALRYKKNVDTVRVAFEDNLDLADEYFGKIREVIYRHKIKPQNQWNMDEKGFARGKAMGGHVLVDVRDPKILIAHSGQREWASVIECIGVCGRTIPPWIIFKSQQLHHEWADHVPAGEDWHFCTSPKGWSDNDVGRRWIRFFEEQTRPADTNEWRLLVCDGHDSHQSAGLIDFCLTHRIAVFHIPPHSSHITQPLDVGCFSSLAQHYSDEVRAICDTGVAQITKRDFIRLYSQARDLAFTRSNLTSAWRKTGLWPLDPSQVTDRCRRRPVSSGSSCLEDLTHPDAVTTPTKSKDVDRHVKALRRELNSPQKNRFEKILSFYRRQEANSSLHECRLKQLEAQFETSKRRKPNRPFAGPRELGVQEMDWRRAEEERLSAQRALKEASNNTSKTQNGSQKRKRASGKENDDHDTQTTGIETQLLNPEVHASATEGYGMGGCMSQFTFG